MVLRQTNFLGQMRIDVPLLRAAESSVAADFDLAVGTIFGGKQALVVRGFALTNITAGSPANAIQMVAANSILVHAGATESGSMYSVPADRANELLASTNSRVEGTFTSSATNFVGLDLVRSADDTTSDIVQFLGATTLLETAKTVPLARTLDYRIIITTTDFSSQSNIIPIAKVVTDSSNNITSVEDARHMAFRLADGGDFPNTQGFYSWPGTRFENTSGDVFSGGDKAILSQKDWQDAVMTRLWEIGGGERWYAATADRNVNLIWVPPAFTNGENFEWSGTNLHWKGLRFLFDNSTGYNNTVTDVTVDTPGLTDLADGECIYVDLNRTSNATVSAAKAVLSQLGPGSIPGARQVIAWRYGANIYTRQWRYPVGTLWTPATTTSQGVVKITRDHLGADTVGASGANDPKAISDRGGTITVPLITNKGLVIKRFDGGTSIIEWQTAAGATLGSIDNDGDLVFAAAAREIAWPNWKLTDAAGSGFRVVDAAVPNRRVDLGGNYNEFRDSSGTRGARVQCGPGGVQFGSLTAIPIILEIGGTLMWQVAATGELQALGGGNRAIQNVLDPVNAQDAATKNYAHRVEGLTQFNWRFASANVGFLFSVAARLSNPVHSVAGTSASQPVSWVAVGDNGNVETAHSLPISGGTWTTRTSNTTRDLRDVAHNAKTSGARFVAVGGDAAPNTGGVISSDDGITWTQRQNTLATDRLWVVKFSPDLDQWCAAGDGGTLFTSADNGVNWTARTSGLADQIFCLAWGNGIWVAGHSTGTSNQISTSTDGVTWTVRTLHANCTGVGALHFFNGLFVAFENAAAGSCFTSTDGITWTERQAVMGANQLPSLHGLTDNGRFWVLSVEDSVGLVHYKYLALDPTSNTGWKQISTEDFSGIISLSIRGNPNSGQVAGVSGISTAWTLKNPVVSF